MNRYKLKSIIFTFIPISLLLITIICIVLASLLEQPTGRGTLYTLLAATGIANVFLMPFPCLLSSILGCIFSKRGLKNGEKTKPFYIISIIEIVISTLMVLLIIYSVFMIGPSV